MIWCPSSNVHWGSPSLSVQCRPTAASVFQGLLWNKKCDVEGCVLHMTAQKLVLTHSLSLSPFPFLSWLPSQHWLPLWYELTIWPRISGTTDAQLFVTGQFKWALSYLFTARDLKINGGCHRTSIPPQRRLTLVLDIVMRRDFDGWCRRLNYALEEKLLAQSRVLIC